MSKDIAINGLRHALNAATHVYQMVADFVLPDDEDEDAVVGVVDFPRSRQRNGYTCGPRCVFAVAEYFRREVDFAEIENAVGTTRDGTSATPMIRYMRHLGLRAGRHSRLTIRGLERALDAGKIAIVDLDGTHWSVVHGINRDHVWLADPSAFSMPRARTSRARFRRRWTGMCILVSAPQTKRRAHRCA